MDGQSGSLAGVLLGKISWTALAHLDNGENGGNEGRIWQGFQ